MNENNALSIIVSRSYALLYPEFPTVACGGRRATRSLRCDPLRSSSRSPLAVPPARPCRFRRFSSALRMVLLTTCISSFFPISRPPAGARRWRGWGGAAVPRHMQALL